MSGPWEKYKSASSPEPSQGEGPWQKFATTEAKPQTTSAGSQAVSAIQGAAQGLSFGFGDEIQGLMEAGGQLLGVKGLGANDFNQSLQTPKTNLKELKKVYAEARDKARAADKEASEKNPGSFLTGQIVGGIAGAKKIPVGNSNSAKNAAIAGGRLGAIQGAGMSEADSVAGLIEDTTVGMGAGTVGGAAGYGATKAGGKIAEAGRAAVKKTGESLKGAAENLAFKSSGAILKDYRTTDTKSAGRWILDKAGLKVLDTVDDVATKAGAAKNAAGKKLDAVYSKAEQQFGEKVNKTGFDPIKDRNLILEKVREELGDSVGAESAVKKVADYLDEVGARQIDRARSVGPVRPDDVRTVMDPRSTNRIKSAIDEQINYARNPLTREPTTEAAFSAARKQISSKVDDGIESLGGNQLLDDLKMANRDYGSAAQVTRVAKDRVNRESANKAFGLTDTIMGGAGIGYGAITNDWGTAGAMVLGKKAVEKYGISALAVAADRISKRMLSSPEIVQQAAANPQAFQVAVLNLTKRVFDSERLADVAKKEQQNPDEKSREPSSDPSTKPKKGPGKWVSDGAEKVASLGVAIDSAAEKDPKVRSLLIKASSLSPNSKAMNTVLAQLNDHLKKGGQ